MDKHNRVTIPINLRKKSNINVVDKVVLVFCQSKDNDLEVCVLPDTESGTKGLNILAYRTIDQKCRIIIPKSLSSITPNWVVYLRDGKIYIRGIL